jgi:phage shock protein C
MMEPNEPKRLKRSQQERIIAGVCGGFAKYVNIDATIIRVLFVILTIFTAVIPGILIYLTMWIIVPKDSEDIQPL